MERNEHLGGLFPRWPIDKRVESRTHLEITCRPFCFVLFSNLAAFTIFLNTQIQAIHDAVQLLSTRRICTRSRGCVCCNNFGFRNSRRPQLRRVIIGQQPIRGKKNVDAAGHKKKSISVTPSRRRVVKRKLVLISALFLRFYDRTLSLLSLTISEASTVCSVCVVPGPLLHLRRECLV
jgi:hypothetical protein